MNNFAILLSCMQQINKEIITRSNIKSDCVIINQCDGDSKEEINIDKDKACLWINSTERGLSKSRNMAIKNSKADICLIADDDEIFKDNIEKVIFDAYKMIPQADIIIFDISNYHKKIKNKIFKFKRLQLLKVSSIQITFKKRPIVEKNLKFDIKLGAGTGNGAGEENKFLLDAYDKGLKIYHYPANIAKMIKNESTWFTGYNEEYFYKRGASTRYILGFWLSLLYAVYFLVFKHNAYNKNISINRAFRCIIRGIIRNDLAK